MPAVLTSLVLIAGTLVLPPPPLASPVRRSKASDVLMLAGSKANPNRKLVANNKLARRNYEILEEIEAGISLVGTEVKSCRAGKLAIRDGYCRIKDGECWLENVNIPKWMSSRHFQHDELRPRRLLLHKREIEKLSRAVDQKGLTVVPLMCYFNDRSLLKVQIGLARGKKLQDKREDLKRRDMQREVGRQLKNIV